jgi:F420H(2)-dependent quinone reductase
VTPEMTPPAVPKLASWMNERSKGKATPAWFLRFHQWIYRRSDGRLGHGMIGAPCLILTTTGRRSHQPRTCAVVYARDGDRLVLTASNEGLDRDPYWLRNVRADPAVVIQVARWKTEATVTVIDQDHPNYRRLWELVNTNNHRRYDGYQAKTTRPIPLVVIDPTVTRAGSGPPED